MSNHQSECRLNIWHSRGNHGSIFRCQTLLITPTLSDPVYVAKSGPNTRGVKAQRARLNLLMRFRQVYSCEKSDPTSKIRSTWSVKRLQTLANSCQTEPGPGVALTKAVFSVPPQTTQHGCGSVGPPREDVSPLNCSGGGRRSQVPPEVRKSTTSEIEPQLLRSGTIFPASSVRLIRRVSD